MNLLRETYDIEVVRVGSAVSISQGVTATLSIIRSYAEAGRKLKT